MSIYRNRLSVKNKYYKHVRDNIVSLSTDNNWLNISSDRESANAIVFGKINFIKQVDSQKYIKLISLCKSLGVELYD